MTVKLWIQAAAKFLLGIVLMGALLFVPAGSFLFFNAWLLMGILFVPMFIVGIGILAKNPDLLSKRLKAKETRKAQSLVVRLSGLMFLLGFVVAGLGFRFRWYALSPVVVMLAVAVFLAAYVLYAEVLRENRYLSRTVEVQSGQKVVDTGLYGIIRHPMYSATLLLFLSMPLVLGSLYSFFIFLAYPVIIAKRIKDEEALLTRELAGYAAYKEKVKYRLIPFIW